LRPQVGEAVDKENENKFDEVYFMERNIYFLFISTIFDYQDGCK